LRETLDGMGRGGEPAFASMIKTGKNLRLLTLTKQNGQVNVTTKEEVITAIETADARVKRLAPALLAHGADPLPDSE